MDNSKNQYRKNHLCLLLNVRFGTQEPLLLKMEIFCYHFRHKMVK